MATDAAAAAGTNNAAAIAGILVLWGCERLDPGEAK